MLAQAPEFELDLIAILLRVVHTACAGTLLGGLVYMRFVLAPRTAEDAEHDCYAGRRGAWAACVGICTALLLASGAYNFWVIITENEVPSLYHMLFGIKFLLAFVVFALMALLAGKTNVAAKLRGKLIRWLNVTLAVVLAIFLLGAVLRSIPKTPKLNPAPVADPPAAELEIE
ncbi:hypothetical protein Pla123a_24610 [Posidoniimonas polymericola]|uniref:Copper resistance protein D n=1 Tax=Posidoniimonas polymericola TaxID=2528002 RepID=A0A5C5YQ86_9BACT|nr:hypothetical protein [Posidoniimonas polymericola]TWT77033.1 hypothetical protein Pla123a_24610 [Posidoniimonas polymericola]